MVSDATDSEPVDAPVLERHRKLAVMAGTKERQVRHAQQLANAERDARRDAVAEERATVVRKMDAEFPLERWEQENFVRMIERGGHHCQLCERGFPKKDGHHYGTQSLGMIPNTPCGDHHAK